jgi:simple sugar transport system permease protein
MGGPVWLGQVPMQAFWTAIVVTFLWFVLNRHRFGEHALFIGDSNQVARVLGVNV